MDKAHEVLVLTELVFECKEPDNKENGNNSNHDKGYKEKWSMIKRDRGWWVLLLQSGQFRPCCMTAKEQLEKSSLLREHFGRNLNETRGAMWIPRGEGTAREKALRQECSWCMFREYCGWNGVSKGMIRRKWDQRCRQGPNHTGILEGPWFESICDGTIWEDLSRRINLILPC